MNKERNARIGEVMKKMDDLNGEIASIKYTDDAREAAELAIKNRKGRMDHDAVWEIICKIVAQMDGVKGIDNDCDFWPCTNVRGLYVYGYDGSRYEIVIKQDKEAKFK